MEDMQSGSRIHYLIKKMLADSITINENMNYAK